MQAIKEKLNDMSALRKAKAEAREEEKAEKELAKARVEVAHEVRLAREAEAAMDLHVTKAAEKVARHEAKRASESTNHHENHGDCPDNIQPSSDHGHSSGQAAYGGGGMIDYSNREAGNNISRSAVEEIGSTYATPGATPGPAYTTKKTETGLKRE